jgi:hypothetical protein
MTKQLVIIGADGLQFEQDTQSTSDYDVVGTFAERLEVVRSGN